MQKLKLNYVDKNKMGNTGCRVLDDRERWHIYPASGPGKPAVYGNTAEPAMGVAGITYVTTWARFVYVAFVIDIFAR